MAIDFPGRNCADAACAAGVGAGVLGWLPGVVAIFAALVATVYYTIQIWESQTVRSLRHRWRKP